MGANLVDFFQRFELLGFFAGYPLFFALVYFAAGFNKRAFTSKWQKLSPLLTSSYALVGALFLLFVLWPLFQGQVVQAGSITMIMLKAWGITAMLFWIPSLRRLPFISLLHSLIFFGLILIDIFSGTNSAPGRDQVRNDMRVLTDSLLLNTLTFITVFIATYIQKIVRQRRAL